MKVEFWENETGSGFDVVPETPAEVAQLIRVVKNTKAEKPTIDLYAANDPRMSVWMKKVAQVAQNNTLTNSKQ